MTESYDKLKQLFVEAQDLKGAAREAFILEACGEGELRGELERLLAIHDDGGGMLAATPYEMPAVIGRYTITGFLGSGGMGVVYRARQEQPGREVALKVLQPVAFGPSALRRLELEAEILGRLQHPGIAQVYEAGTWQSSTGRQPFFAMELVEGERLSEYVEHNDLGTTEKLQLFVSICDAVEHAHRKGVIHRDLKPGNILVTEDGRAKILDFGVARLTDSDAYLTTLQTGVGQLIGTIPYMSPEQVGGDVGALDTRADVYALGVMLYELLSGTLPFDLANKSIPETARMIRDDEHVPLSSIDRTLRGDLETIVGKAIEKDTARRYGSAAALASDVRRSLADEPIVARPTSTMYQLRKFARRNKGLVAGTALGVTMLLAGAIIATHFAIRANQRSQRAEAGMRVLLGTMMQIDRTPVEHTFHAALLDARTDRGSGLEALARGLIVVYEEGLGPDAAGTVGCRNALFELLHDELGRRDAAIEMAEETLVRAQRMDPDAYRRTEYLRHAFYNAAIANVRDDRVQRALELHDAMIQQTRDRVGFRGIGLDVQRRLVHALETRGHVAAATMIQRDVVEAAEAHWGPESSAAALVREELDRLSGERLASVEPADRPSTELIRPVAHWPGEGSARDVIGEHHGTLRNGVSFAPGLVDRAFRFDGIDDIIDFGDGSIFEVDRDGAVTIAMWVYLTRTGPVHICGKRVGCGYDFDFYQLSFEYPSNYERWRHMVLAVDGRAREIRFYFDGLWIQTDPLRYEGTDAPFLLGNSGDCPFHYEGLLDEVRCYDRALTHDEVVALYRADRDAASSS